MARFERDFRQLIRRLDTLFQGQVRINVDNIFCESNNKSSNQSDNDDDRSSFATFYVEITPNDGDYAHASYVFSIETNDEGPYPDYPPIVSCLTRIYHPNIDTRNGQCHDNVCVSVLSDWQSGEVDFTLEDLVQGLIFLFYNPNPSDPLVSHFCSDTHNFAENVRISIEGGCVEDYEYSDFEVNYGYQRYLDETEENLQERFFSMALNDPHDVELTENERSDRVDEIIVPSIENSMILKEVPISS